MISRENTHKFNTLFKPPKIAVHYYGSWKHKLGSEDTHPWSLYGEFGPIKEMQFEQHLKNIYEHKTATL